MNSFGFLLTNPQYMRTMDARRYEELVAEMFRRKGYHVELTPPARDRGVDIIAIRRDEVGAGLTV